MTLLPLIKMGSPRLKNWKGNGSLKNIMKPKLIIIMKINGFEYTQDEIMEALQNKGYYFVEHDFLFEDETFPNGMETFERTLLCAIKKDKETLTESDILENVAIKEFQKEFIKPKLV